jgi:hypothetical protein
MRFWWDCAIPLELLPYRSVTPRVSEEVTVLFGLAERSAVDEQLAVDEPEDAQAKLFFSTSCWTCIEVGHLDAYTHA